MPSDAPGEPVTPGADGALLRLHPLSWLFVLLTQLRPVVLPLLVLLFFGQGEWWELFIVVGAISVAAYSLIYSIGFRYRLGGGELLVKEGIFARTERHIPYGRIQNIVRRRNLLHRLFGVAELRLESAGGSTPEAVMNVITQEAAEAIESVLRAGPTPAAVDSAPARSAALLSLGASELFRLGLAQNRGGVLVGALFAFAWQFEPWERSGVREYFRMLRDIVTAGTSLFSGPFALAFAAAGFLVLFYLAVKLISIAMSFLSFHGFSLSWDGKRVATEGGLLTRHGASARIDKIQRLIHGENWVSRRLGRRWLSCDVAAGAKLGNEDQHQRLRWLAPIATAAQIEQLTAELVPGAELSRCQWQALHPRAWRRIFKSHLFFLCLGIIPIALFWRWYALPVWGLGAVWALIDARGSARFAGYSCTNGVFAFRSGFVSRQWVVARVAKGQALTYDASPFDRRAGMANISLDTAGAATVGSRLTVPYLGETEARSLLADLRAQIDGGA